MIYTIIQDMIDYNIYDTKRINHALKVYTYAKLIGEMEKLDKEKLTALEIAAVLHDIGIKECERKYNSTNGFLQQIEGPIVAKEILNKYNIDNQLKDRVCFLISKHHTFINVDGYDHQILLEADLIVNTHEGNITNYAFWNAVDQLFKTSSGKEIADKVIKRL